MPKTDTVKIGPEIDKKLYTKLSKVAEQNGQSMRFVLERAMENYIRLVAPAQTDVRPEIMAHVRRSISKNRKLLELLAKG
jgi:predicted transcriptional regulator